jgi:DNA-binding transcriptional ArsR family regulator
MPAQSDEMMAATPEMHRIRPVMKALSDRVRWHIIELLVARGELSVGDLAQLVPVAKTTVSYHLRLLRESGVVTVRKSGQHRFVSVNHTEFGVYVAEIVDELDRLAPL